jgi:hypothetical protein
MVGNLYGGFAISVDLTIRTHIEDSNIESQYRRRMLETLAGCLALVVAPVRAALSLGA